jgi:hypothetical protein
MKANSVYYQLMSPIAVGFISVLLLGCNKDEPKTIPTVVTSTSITDVSTESAIGGGTITSDGNVTIKAAGLVYSSLNGQPSLSDDKTSESVTSGSFTSKMSGLLSGKKYHVRAYATNDVGTAYGDVVDFSTGNAAPTVTNVTVTGTAEANKTVTANYTYVDAEGDSQGGTSFQWYVADAVSGTNETAIVGATAATFLIQSAQTGKFIRVGVTPKALTGTSPGIEVKSSFNTAVGDATTVTFTYNSTQVTYSIIVSAATGKRWLDRNLGAPNSPVAVDDYANYGDLFQWGRRADGHQLVNRTGPSDGDQIGVNGKTSTVAPFEYSTTITPSHSKFIIADAANGPFDWLTNAHNELWQGVNGPNNPCPTGWRLATKAEWDAENITTLADGFSKLKLTYTGQHSGGSGNFIQIATLSNYWSSTTDASITPLGIYRFALASGAAATTIVSSRAGGLPVRCIKD